MYCNQDCFLRCFRCIFSVAQINYSFKYFSLYFYTITFLNFPFVLSICMFPRSSVVILTILVALLNIFSGLNKVQSCGISIQMLLKLNLNCI